MTVTKSVMLAGLPGEETLSYETVWHCDEPPEDKTYVVVEQWWNGNYAERHIIEIRIVGPRLGPS